MDKTTVDRQKTSIYQSMGQKKYKELQEANRLPLEFKEDDVGLAWVIPEFADDEGMIAVGTCTRSTLTMQIQLWGPRENSINGQSPGWQILAKGVTTADNMELGKPYRLPIALDGLVDSLRQQNIQNSAGSIFYRLNDAWFQQMVSNCVNRGDNVNFDPLILQLFGDANGRARFINALIEGSHNAGSWDYLKDGPKHPNEVCTSLAAFDPNDRDMVKTCTKYAQHVYCLREHAIIPSGSKINGNRLLMPSGQVIEGVSILGLGNQTTAKDLDVYGCYGGITQNCLRRHRDHGKEIFSDDETDRTHYRISRLIRKLRDFSYNMYRVMSFEAKSHVLKLENGLHIAEQCIINWDDSINPVLKRPASELSQEFLSYGSMKSFTSVAKEYPFCSTIRGCHDMARRAIGLPGLDQSWGDIVLGQNWQTPIRAGTVSYEGVTWFRFPIHDNKGEVYKYVYPRARFVAVKTPKDSAGGVYYRMNPRPGPKEYTIPNGDRLDKGQKLQVAWEIMVDGKGPHPNRLVSLPIPGPLADGIWERAEDIALQAQYVARNGQQCMQYIASKDLKGGQRQGDSAVANALKQLNHPYAHTIECIAALEAWTWEGDVAPDWMRVHPCRVSEVNLDWFQRAWRITTVIGPTMPLPRLLGGADPLGPQAIEFNGNIIRNAIGTSSPLIIGDAKGVGSSGFCEYRRGGKDKSKNRDFETVQLPNGKSTQVCKNCTSPAKDPKLTAPTRAEESYDGGRK
ncbi:hypothetical protein PG984_005889 [Apiospora sp. TS-2023a]